MLAACGMSLHHGPGVDPPAPTTTRAVPTGVHGAQRLMDAFDHRFNDVLDRVRGPRYEAEQWQRVNAMGRLRTARFSTWMEQAAGLERPAPTWKHTVTSVVGRAHDGSRDALALLGAVSGYQPAGGDAAGHTSQQAALWVMERDAQHPHWRMTDLVFLEDDHLRWPGGRSTAGSPSPGTSSAGDDDTVSVEDALSAVISALEDDDLTGLRGADHLTRLKHSVRVGEDVEDRYSCYPRSAQPGTTTLGEPDRVMLTDWSTPLVVLRLHCDIDHTATGSGSITVPAYKATVDDLPRRSDHTQEAYSLSVVVALKDAPVVAGVGVYPVLRNGVSPPGQ